MEVAPFRDRINFGAYLSGAGLTGSAVEIGTHRGEFAKPLMDLWSGKLTCVDPWVNGYDPSDPASSSDRRNDYHETTLRLGPWLDTRCTLLKTTSIEASLLFHNNSQDFVYIDGCHQPDSVRQDIEIWYNKVKPGGILAGHDFMCINEREGGWGKYIQEIVVDYCRSINRIVYLVIETDNQPWSWFIVK